MSRFRTQTKPYCEDYRTHCAPDEGFRALLRRWLPTSLRADRNRRQGRETLYPREAPYPSLPPPAVIDKMAWIHQLMQDSLIAMHRPRLA